MGCSFSIPLFSFLFLYFSFMFLYDSFTFLCLFLLFLDFSFTFLLFSFLFLYFSFMFLYVSFTFLCFFMFFPSFLFFSFTCPLFSFICFTMFYSKKLRSLFRGLVSKDFRKCLLTGANLWVLFRGHRAPKVPPFHERFLHVFKTRTSIWSWQFFWGAEFVIFNVLGFHSTSGLGGFKRKQNNLKTRKHYKTLDRNTNTLFRGFYYCLQKFWRTLRGAWLKQFQLFRNQQKWRFRARLHLESLLALIDMALGTSTCTSQMSVDPWHFGTKRTYACSSKGSNQTVVKLLSTAREQIQTTLDCLTTSAVLQQLFRRKSRWIGQTALAVSHL